MTSSISASCNPAAFASRQSAFCGKPMAPRLVQPARSTSHNAPIVSMSDVSPPYDLNKFSFKPIKESIVSREMTRRYMTDVITYADTDVIVVGAGSAGLSCTYELSKNPI